jgi:hypothetical protein
MRLGRYVFDGESRYFNTEKRLQSVADTSSWFTEFLAEGLHRHGIYFPAFEVIF